MHGFDFAQQQLDEARARRHAGEGLVAPAASPARDLARIRFHILNTARHNWRLQHGLVAIACEKIGEARRDAAPYTPAPRVCTQCGRRTQPCGFCDHEMCPKCEAHLHGDCVP